MAKDKKIKKYKISITVIITSVTILVTILVAGIVTFYSMTNNKSVVESQTEKMLESSSKGYGNELDNQFLVFENAIDSIVNYIQVSYDVNSSSSSSYNEQFMIELSSYISAVSKEDDKILDVWSFMDTSRTTYMEYAWYEQGTPRDIGDKTEEYTKYVANDKGAVFDFAHQTELLKAPKWQSPRYDETLGCYTVTYAYPVFIGGFYYGMVGIELNLQSLESLVKSIELYETGQAFIVDNYGHFLIHNQYDLTKNISDSEYSDMSHKESGLEIINGKYVSCYKMSNGYYVFLEAPIDEVMADSNARQKQAIIACLVLILISAVIIAILTRLIIRPVVKITDDLNQAAEGIFTGNNYRKYKKNRTEVGVLSRSFEDMQASIKNTVVTITDSSESLHSTADTLGNVISKFVDQTSSISTATEELAAGTEETCNIVEGLNNSFKEIVKDLELLDKEKEKGNHNISEIRERALDLMVSAENNKEEVSKEVELSKKQLEEAIKNSRQVETIRDLSASIMEIADQTGLLSLNASIEAARAGESGRGFAVVANEIGNLANVSQNTAKKIQEIVTMVTSSVEQLSETSNRISEYLNKQIFFTLENLSKTSEQYSADAHNMAEVLDNITNLSESIELKTKNTFDSLDVLLKSAEQGSLGTNELAQNSEKILMGSNEIEREINELKNVIAALLESISKFRF
jgi:methyl-accepting chemotaxis protein